ncbi:murein biosynthesis integral membrane protein MurJ [Fontivita pretiosa]|uniref:murein biosynthesis integral membrane protein MurJ n=1 Tax=Fontivita pretiosa TaxID=2989684 RepID=UPI003D178553
MSDEAAILSSPQSKSSPAARSFVSHARLIGAITFVSRIVGLLREMIAFRYFGDTGVWAAWKVAFTVPNLFRKLLGEGALTGAFVPLYAQAVKRDEQAAEGGQHAAIHSAHDFAAAAVNLLGGLLLAITILGELLLLGLLVLFDWSANNLLVLRFSVIMLPYVTLVCLTAFLGGILQVHHRFAAFAFTAVVLNLCLIVIIAIVAKTFDLTDRVQQITAAYWLCGGVLLAGVAQMLILFPSLRAAGFRFRIMLGCWTPAVKQLMLLTLPLAGGAGVLQIGVMLDKGIGQFLAAGPGYETLSVFGYVIRVPLLEGAAARLDLAQFMYQFPLGVFAIALATAIFPTLGREATDPTSESFKSALRQGIEASLFIGLPASAGMIIVATPAIRLLFEGGRFSATSAQWVALSTAIYSGAIWAFSMLQIINRGFYSLHDAHTPLKWTAYNLLINLVVELPLLWTGLRESGMAVGTLVSFAIQSIAMLWILDRRLGGLGLRQSAAPVGRMIAATLLMWLACWSVQRMPGFPGGSGKIVWGMQLVILMTVGAAVYFAACAAMGIDVTKHLRRRARQF